MQLHRLYNLLMCEALECGRLTRLTFLNVKLQQSVFGMPRLLLKCQLML